MLTAAEIVLDDLTKKRAAKTGETYAQAYDRVVLEKPHLYERHNEAIRAMGSTNVLEELNKAVAKSASQAIKSDGAKAAEKAIEDAARAVQKRDGLSHHAAYDQAVLERPDLYEQYINAKASADRA